MEFKIEKKKLMTAVELASNAVAKKTTNPILSGILLDIKENELNIYATDLQTGFHKKEEINYSDEEFSFVVDQKVFSDIIRTLPDGPVRIIYDGTLQLESGHSNFKIPTMDAGEFPNVIPDVSGNSISLNREETLKMIEKVIFCALKDNDPLSKNLNGLYWDFRDGGYLTLIASDSYRLALSETKIENEDMPSSFLLSLKSMEELKIVLANSKTDQFTLNFDGSRSLFTFGKENIQLILNVVDAKYPNYTEIIPQAFKTKIISNSKNFLDSLKRVSIAAGKSEQVKLEIEETNITLKANSPDVGEAKEIIDIEKDGEDLIIAYSPRFLREAVEKVETTEFEFNISGEINPTVIKPIEDNSYMYIVMPTRWAWW